MCSLSQPEIKKRWAAAYTAAVRCLQQTDPACLQTRHGILIRDQQLPIRYLNRDYTIALPEVRFAPGRLTVTEQILLMHYLGSTGTDPGKGEFLSYRSLPGGMFYDYAYRKNGPGRLLAAFGASPELLIPAGIRLGGMRAEYQDLSVNLPVLPALNVVIILHRGDDEFPPDVNILFQDTITNFLGLEDIAQLAGCLAGHLQQAKGTLETSG